MRLSEGAMIMIMMMLPMRGIVTMMGLILMICWCLLPSPQGRLSFSAGPAVISCYLRA